MLDRRAKFPTTSRVTFSGCTRCLVTGLVDCTHQQSRIADKARLSLPSCDGSERFQNSDLSGRDTTIPRKRSGLCLIYDVLLSDIARIVHSCSRSSASITETASPGNYTQIGTKWCLRLLPASRRRRRQLRPTVQAVAGGQSLSLTYRHAPLLACLAAIFEYFLEPLTRRICGFDIVDFRHNGQDKGTETLFCRMTRKQRRLSFCILTLVAYLTSTTMYTARPVR